MTDGQIMEAIPTIFATGVMAKVGSDTLKGLKKKKKRAYVYKHAGKKKKLARVV